MLMAIQEKNLGSHNCIYVSMSTETFSYYDFAEKITDHSSGDVAVDFYHLYKVQSNQFVNVDHIVVIRSFVFYFLFFFKGLKP